MVPNARERKALEKLRYEEWEYVASLYPAGAGTISGMHEKGWIEMLPPPPTGSKRCRITQAGKDALDAPIEKPLARRSLTVLAPRLKTSDFRTVKPSRRS